MPWFSQRDLNAPADLRLFCFPHAGSGAAGFYRWKRLFPASIAVCPVLLPGRETRFAEPSMTSANALVEALLPELGITKPYALYGHSMGSLLAYECVSRLPRTGSGAPLALFVSGRNAPSANPGHHTLHALEDKALIEALRQRYGTHGAELLDDPELRELFLPIVRADLEVVETYRHPEAEPLRCPVLAFAGAEDTSVSDEGLHAWAGVTTGAFTAQRLPGDHFFQFGQSQSALVTTIQNTLLQLAISPQST